MVVINVLLIIIAVLLALILSCSYVTLAVIIAKINREKKEEQQ